MSDISPVSVLSPAALRAGDGLFNKPSSFMISVADVSSLPLGDVPEIAFAGRSNVGKSSLLNCLLRRRSLVKVSRTPGHTRMLNFFAVGDYLRVVDMPGYGYARAPKRLSSNFGGLVGGYVRGRRNLRLLCLLIDSRRGVMASDEAFCDDLDNAGVSYLPILTKCDKVSESSLGGLRERLLLLFGGRSGAYPWVLATSALRGDGFSELRGFLASVLDYSG